MWCAVVLKRPQCSFFIWFYQPIRYLSTIWFSLFYSVSSSISLFFFKFAWSSVFHLNRVWLLHSISHKCIMYEKYTYFFSICVNLWFFFLSMKFSWICFFLCEYFFSSSSSASESKRLLWQESIALSLSGAHVFPNPLDAKKKYKLHEKVI